MELGVRADTTLHELDRFLRSVWLECCGHLSHFDIEGVVYSVMVPRPGDDFAFLPMDEREEQWRHMGRTVATAILPATWFEHQYDYGTTTDLDLRHAESLRDWCRRFVRCSPGTGKDRRACQEPSPAVLLSVRTPGAVADSFQGGRIR